MLRSERRSWAWRCNFDRLFAGGVAWPLSVVNSRRGGPTCGRNKSCALATVAWRRLAVDGTERLPHDGSEDVGLAVLEVFVVLGAGFRILLAWALRPNVGAVEWARHSNIQRESSLPFPIWDGHVAW